MKTEVTFSELEILLDIIAEEKRQNKILQALLENKASQGLVVNPEAYSACMRNLRTLEQSTREKRDIFEMIIHEFKELKYDVQEDLDRIQGKIAQLDI